MHKVTWIMHDVLPQNCCTLFITNADTQRMRQLLRTTFLEVIKDSGGTAHSPGNAAAAEGFVLNVISNFSFGWPFDFVNRDVKVPMNARGVRKGFTSTIYEETLFISETWWIRSARRAPGGQTQKSDPPFLLEVAQPQLQRLCPGVDRSSKGRGETQFHLPGEAIVQVDPRHSG